MSVVTAETDYIQVYLVLWLFFYEFMKCIQIEQFIWNYPCSLLPTDTQKWIPYCIARRPLSVCSFVWEHPNTGIDHVSVYWPLSGIIGIKFVFYLKLWSRTEEVQACCWLSWYVTLIVMHQLKFLFKCLLCPTNEPILINKL